jgi:hypothetical protein
MVWFVTDDKFHASEEVMSIPRGERLAAIGLWDLAGSWSSDRLKDGYVPLDFIDHIGGTIEQAEWLVKAKLWTRVGKRGYQFRNWSKWQPTRDAVEAKRKAERDRKADWRANKAEKAGASPLLVPRDIVRSPLYPVPIPTQPRETDTNASVSHWTDGVEAGDKPGDNVEYADIVLATSDRLSKLASEPISAAKAMTVVDLILERGGKRVRNPQRYVLGVLKQSGMEWLQYVFEGKVPA